MFIPIGIHLFFTASSDGQLFEGTKVLTWGCFEHLGIGQDNVPGPQDSWVQFLEISNENLYQNWSAGGRRRKVNFHATRASQEWNWRPGIRCRDHCLSSRGSSVDTTGHSRVLMESLLKRSLLCTLMSPCS